MAERTCRVWPQRPNHSRPLNLALAGECQSMDWIEWVVAEHEKKTHLLGTKPKVLMRLNCLAVQMHLNETWRKALRDFYPERRFVDACLLPCWQNQGGFTFLMFCYRIVSLPGNTAALLWQCEGPGLGAGSGCARACVDTARAACKRHQRKHRWTPRAKNTCFRFYNQERQGEKREKQRNLFKHSTSLNHSTIALLFLWFVWLWLLCKQV